MTLMTNLKKPELQSKMESEFKYTEEANAKAKQDIENYCLTYFDDSIITADGFELAFLGCGYSYSGSYAIYHMHTCIEILIQRDGMSYDEAEEYMEFNVTGAFVGDRMPVFLVPMKELYEYQS